MKITDVARKCPVQRFFLAALITTLLVHIALTLRLRLFSHSMQYEPSKKTKALIQSTSLRYQPPGRSYPGIPFNNTETFLSRIGFPIIDLVNITRGNLGQFVFATGFSPNYFYIGMDAVATIQKVFPKHTVYVYDLSNGTFKVDEVEKMKLLCNVVYRWFDFNLFPPHVGYLEFYAWKPIIIHELLQEHQGVFWFDSSIRFHLADLSTVVGPAVTNGGVLVYDKTRSSNFAATHPEMYRYLPIPKAAMVNATMRGAGILFLYRTKFVYENIVRWWVLCALEKNCIAPTKDLKRICGFVRRDVYDDCHRYDQSALNILLANSFPYNDAAYSNPNGGISVARGSQGKEQVFVCPGKETTINFKIAPSVYFATSKL